MSQVEIYYFSGTGNSLHVARELQERIPGVTLIPIMSVMKEESIRSTADTVGLVFPINAFTMPNIFKEFLKKADFSSASYLFAVGTRCSDPKVFTHINRLLKGQKLDACFSIEMPQNYIPVFEVYSSEEIAACESALQQRLVDMTDIITCRRPYHEPKLPLFTRIMIGILFPVIRFVFNVTRYFGLAKAFYADERCTGCGTCEKVCLSGKISMRDGKPVWNPDTDCIFCLACLHYCPVRAIQAKGKKTEKRGRYHHPDIKPGDIAGQKKKVEGNTV
jgi:ferredoxin